MNKITSINGTLVAPLNKLNEHVENETAHVTEEERDAWNAQTTVKAKGILMATQEDLDGHVDDTTVHITEDERATWNAKAEVSEIDAKVNKDIFDAHAENATVHLTAEERLRWNATLELDETGNMTLDGMLTTLQLKADGRLIINNPAGSLGNNTHNQIYGTTWFYQQGEFRSGFICRGDVWMESGVLRINTSASITCNGFASFSKPINANGGINIPQTVGAPTKESAVNRLIADGLAVVREAFEKPAYLTSTTTFGAGGTLTHVDQHQIRLRVVGSGPATVQVNLTSFGGAGPNYGRVCGYMIPFVPSVLGDNKITFVTGYFNSPNFVISTAQPLNTFTVSPRSSTNNNFCRIIDVTFYRTVDSGLGGYPVRVREMLYDSTAQVWMVYTTMSYVPSFNTNFASISNLVFQQGRRGYVDDCSLWIVLGGGAGISGPLKIASLHGVRDTFNWNGLTNLWWDATAISSGVYAEIGKCTVMAYSDPNGYNGAYYAFSTLEQDNRQGEATETEFTPYE